MSSSPLLARLLLKLLLPADTREFILGDLEEEFAVRVLPARGPRAARRWYWGVAVRSLGAQWSPRGVGARRAGGRGSRRDPSVGTLTHPPKRNGAGAPMVDLLIQDLRHARRFLAKNAGFTLITALTLALGIGANTAVFTVLNRVVLKPLPYREPGRLVRLYQDKRGDPATGGWVAGAAFLDYREMAEGLEAVGALYNYRDEGFALTGQGEPRRVRALPVSSDLFDVYRVRPLLGRIFTREEERSDARVVVLSHRLWAAYSDRDDGIIGQSMLLDGEAYQVIGVMPPGFVDVVGGDADLWLPLELQDQNATQNRGNHYLSVIGRLRNGWSLEEAQAQLTVLSASLEQEYSESDKGYFARVVPLQEDVVGNAGTMLLLLLSAAGLVLLIACVNVANVSVARNLAREGDLTIRSALGCGRGRLLRMLMLESVTIGIIGGLAGLGLAKWGVAALLALSPDAVPLAGEVSFDGRLFAFALGVTLLTVLLSGLLPALHQVRLSPASSLRAHVPSTSVGAKGRRARDFLVASQMGLAIVLLVGAGLLVRSLRELNRVDLGITAGHTTTFEVQLGGPRYEDAQSRIQFHRMFTEALGAQPGVLHAGAVSRLPVTGRYNDWGFAHLGADGTTQWGVADVRVVEGQYFQALDIRRVRGRDLETSDTRDSPPVVLVNQKLADTYYSGRDPLGHSVWFQGQTWRIVGIMRDVAHDHRGSVAPMIYTSHAQFAFDRSWSMSYVVTTATDREDLPGRIRDVLAAIDPTAVVYNLEPMEQVMGTAIAPERFSLALMGAFALMAVLLAAVGLYGVTAFTVNQRTREIGIRVALGADRSAVLWSVVRKGLTVAGAGVAVGLAIAFGLAKIFPAVLFGISPVDLPTFAGMPGILGFVAFLAAYVPARRATKVEAVEALKLE